MYIEFSGIYHHDTFDETLSLVFQADSIDTIKTFAESRNIVILHCDAYDRDPKTLYHYFVRFTFEATDITVWGHRDTINDALENVAIRQVPVIDANTKNKMYSPEQIHAKIKQYGQLDKQHEEAPKTFASEVKSKALHDPTVSRYQKIAEKTLQSLPLQRQKFDGYISSVHEKKLTTLETDLQKLKRSTNIEKIRLLIDEVIHTIGAIEIDYLTGIEKKPLVAGSRVNNVHVINAIDHYQRSLQAKEIAMVDTWIERWYTTFGEAGIYIYLLGQELYLRLLHDKKETLLSRLLSACYLAIIVLVVSIAYQELFVATSDSSLLWLQIIGIAYLGLVVQGLQRLQKIAFGWKVCIIIGAFLVYNRIRYRIGSYFVLF